MDISWAEDPEVVKLAQELAELRHVSARDAVAKALLRDLAEEREIAARQEEIEVIARKVHALIIDPPPASDHSWLYDDDGLPA